MKVLRAAVVLGVSTPLVVLACGADDGSTPQRGAAGQGGESAGTSGASGAGTSGASGGEPAQAGSPGVDGGASSGGAPDTAGQPSGGAGGAPSLPEPACGDAQLNDALPCFGEPQPLSLIEGAAQDVAIGEWDAEDGRDLLVASNGGLRYFSNDAGALAGETYVGTAGSVLGSAQFSSEGNLDLLLGGADTATTVAFGGGDGTVVATGSPTTSAEGALYNFFVADVAGSGPSPDFVVTYNYTVSVVIMSGNEGEGFQTHHDAIFVQQARDGVLAKLGSAQWVVYSSEGNLERRLVTYEAGEVALADEGDVTPVGGSPEQLDVGDFNEDGFDDLAATLTDSGDVSVLFGDGSATGGFAIVEGTSRFLTLTIAGSAAAKTQRDVKVGDFNGDGHADLAVSVQGLDSVAIFTGDGQGAFSEPLLVSTGAGSGPARLAVGDVNDDGVDDLAVVAETSGTVVVLLSAP